MCIEISIFDVKLYYDAAYEEKAQARVNLARFRRLLAHAEALEAQYRAQLPRPALSAGRVA